LGGEASFLRRTEARLKSNLGFAEDRSSELQREVTVLRQQVASYEASEHEAQLLEEVQRSVSRESSAGGTIAAKMKGVFEVSKIQCSMLGFPYFCFDIDGKGGVHGPEPWACICCHADDFYIFSTKSYQKYYLKQSLLAHAAVYFRLVLWERF